MIEHQIEGGRSVSTFYSLDEYAEYAKSAPTSKGKRSNHHPDSSDEWHAYTTLKKAGELAKYGWTDKLQDTMRLVDSALKTTEQERPTVEWAPTYDVAGGECDIDRYLVGVPECMIEYPPMTVSKVGRVVTFCASTCYSGSQSAESVIRRGQAIAACALALLETGHAVELWADMSVSDKRTVSHRVLVKGAHDVIDPSRIIFAYAHPAMLRQLFFAATFHLPSDWLSAISAGGGWGAPTKPVQDLPEGTIYLPELKYGQDVPDADKFIIQTLKDIGLVD